MSDAEIYDFVFLGGGKGGKSLAMELANAGKRVALIEEGMIGGSCINIACIPTKALIQNARVAHTIRSSTILHDRISDPTIDMAKVHPRVRAVVDGMVGLIANAFKSAGFQLLLGTGRFVGKRTLRIDLNSGGVMFVKGEHVFINTGTRAAIPDIAGLRKAIPMTHVEALQLTNQPEHLLVVGGGYVGVEMAQAFRRLGSKVTLIQRAERLLPLEDEDISAVVEKCFRKENIDVRTSATPARVAGLSGDEVQMVLDDGETLTASHILVATGRVPRTNNIGLEEAGVEIDSRGFIRVNEFLMTTAPQTWAIGEVAGTRMFTHASYDDYRVLRSNLSGGRRSTRDRIIPHAVFIEPEIGRIGLNERDAKLMNYRVRTSKISMDAVPRARTNCNVDGFMKVIVNADSDLILGFAMVGSNAGEVVAAIQMAMLGNLPWYVVRDAVIAHPTMAEGLNILFERLAPKPGN